MEHLVNQVQQWGYLIVFLGSLIEGESVILTASFLAYQGILSLPKVMLVAFIGTLTADQGLYFIGRYYGPAIFERYPRLRIRADRAFRLLHRWDIWFILSNRFIYGIRMISPVVIGASGISPSRFSPLNFLAAIVWVTVSCGGGYLAGNSIETLLNNFERTGKYFLLFLVLLLIIVVGVVWWVKKRKKHKTQAPSYEDKEPLQ